MDGFRCDAVAFMLEAEHLRDNPVINKSLPVRINISLYSESRTYVHISFLMKKLCGVRIPLNIEPCSFSEDIGRKNSELLIKQGRSNMNGAGCLQSTG